jgi:putative inorganic carbon (hco3(-)) transporter
VPLRGVILIGFILASLPVCFFRPFYGIALWTIIAFLNPQGFTWSAASALPWAQIVAAPTIAGLLIFVGGWYRLMSREVLLVLLLWVWFLITSFVSSTNPLFAHHADDTWYRFSFVSKILLMAVLTIPIVDTLAKLRLLFLVIAGCFGVFVVKALPFVIMSGGAHRLYGPPNSMIADNNDFGLALNMTLPIFFFLAQSESKPWLKRLFGFLFLATIPSIFFTYSRGALVGLVIVSALMILTLSLKQRVMLVPVIVGALVFALLFAPESWKERMDPTRSDAVDASAKARLYAWAFARNLAAEYPVTGGGFATFTHSLYSRYAPNGAGRNIHGAHSVYFQVLAEHGYAGLTLYLTLIASCFLTTRSVSRAAKLREDRTAVQYANMIRFSLTAFLTSGVFLGRAYFDYFFCLVSCAVILKRVTAEHWAAEDDEAEDDREHDRVWAASQPHLALPSAQETTQWQLTPARPQ